MDKAEKEALFQYIKSRSFGHQVDGVRLALRHPAFLIADEPGAGKTKQVIDTAQVLFSRGIIDRVVVVCPAALKSLWFDPDTGQISDFIWDKLSTEVVLFHSNTDYWDQNHTDEVPTLKWLITNYEYLRKKDKLRTVKRWVGSKTMLVLDESSYVKTWGSQQTKAIREIRKKVARVLLLNGTFVTENPMDLFAQCNVMDPAILDCKYIYNFKDRYGIKGGFKGREIVGWKNLDELKRRVKPFYVRRLKKNCLDLPEKLPPVRLSCPLSENTWRMYLEMKTQFVAWLVEYKKGEKSVARHATTKAMRLSQLTSGYLGGFKVKEDEEDSPKEPAVVKEIGSEKTDFFLRWYREQLEINPNLKLVVWCRFRQEAERLHKLICKLPHSKTKGNIGLMIGGQSESVRQATINLLDPRYSPKDEPCIVIATLGTGSVGLNLSAASMSVYLSNSSVLNHRIQSEERIHRTGQVNQVTSVDIIATGPKRERTFDYYVLQSLTKKEDMASWTLDEWINLAKAA